ncbi:glutathione degradosome [Chiua virens]|nr:glutathione degradosome [Chiua virens]
MGEMNVKVPPPSVSKPAPSPSSPRLLHSLGDVNKSVLSLMADDRHIFVGGQCQDISVWDKQSYTLKTSLRGHTGSILALELAEQRQWLFSASGDSTVRIWSTVTFAAVYILHPYLEIGAGDLFSWLGILSYNPFTLGVRTRRYSGSTFLSKLSRNRSLLGHPRPLAKFTNSLTVILNTPTNQPISWQTNISCSLSLVTSSCCNNVIEIPASNVLDSAHFGYVYCMTMIPSQRTGSDDAALQSDAMYHLLTGSGDETVKIWACTTSGPVLKHTFECNHGAVLSLAVSGDTIFAGCQEGYVQVFDLETKTLVRTIMIQENIDILSLSMVSSELYTCSSNGKIHRWSPRFNCTASWTAHEGIVLSSIVTRLSEGDRFALISGANDGLVKIWEVDLPSRGISASSSESCLPQADDDEHDVMTYALSIFVSIPSVSSDPLHRQDCRQAATWLNKCLHQLGGDSTLLPTGKNTNPIVLSTFHGARGKHPKPRILFYGHYDVISAPRDGWHSGPFTVSGRDGYLYGRGVSDDKGPIMAVACACSRIVTEARAWCRFGVPDRGFVTIFLHIFDMLILAVSNRSHRCYLAQPCITYGLRGVVHATVEIASGAPDQHSGIEGGAATEPMFDMIRLLAKLTDSQGKVELPGFYDSVRPQTEDEKQLYELLSSVAQSPASVLSSRWREPSLTVHNISVSGPGNPTVIPGKVTAKLSLRIVPDQDLETVSRALVAHLNACFDVFQSPNTFSVTIDHTADWWLGDLDSPWFKALETAVCEEWGVQPLRIREGGSIPSVPCLEKMFQCRALHLPLGQSSDRAHLPNERISLANLWRGKAVLERFLTKVADACPPVS